MNILSIIIKEIKQNLKDKKAMCTMVLFPILLISILGMALNSAFENNTNLKVECFIVYKAKVIFRKILKRIL